MEGFDHRPQGQRLDAKDAECQDITAEQYHEGYGISKDSSQDALLEKISCVLDENMWPNTEDQVD